MQWHAITAGKVELKSDELTDSKYVHINRALTNARMEIRLSSAATFGKLRGMVTP